MMNRALILSDRGKVGTRKQAEVLCQALNLDFEIVEIDRALGGWLLPSQWFCKIIEKQTSSRHFHLIVSAGRRSAIWGVRYARLTQTPCYHIMDPGWLLRRLFDRVIVPDHDRLTGPNIISMQGALVRPNLDNYEKRTDLQAYLDPSKQTVAIIIGGTTRSYQFTQDILQQWTQALDRALAKQGMNVVITFSRRTDLPVQEHFKNWAKAHRAYVWDGSEPNPYTHYLSVADYILVTQDSIAMLSDACFTGKPTYVLRLAGTNQKFDFFLNQLERTDRIRWFEGDLVHWQYEPLREYERVGSMLRSLES